jgi:TonB family protein
MKTIISIVTILILLCSIQNTFAQKNPKKRAPKSKLTKIVSCGVCNQEAIYLPNPEYPKAAQAVHASGAVNVEILIDEKGNVESAKAVSGHPLLHAESVKSALKAKFKPFTLSGTPVKVRGTIVYKFVNHSPIPPQQDIVGIINGKAISLPKPPFPSCNCKFGKKSTVIVQAEIDEYGNVISAKAISGHPILKQASEQAARFAKFSETKILGIPVKAKALFTYEFLTDVGSVNVTVNSVQSIEQEK